MARVQNLSTQCMEVTSAFAPVLLHCDDDPANAVARLVRGTQVTVYSRPYGDCYRLVSGGFVPAADLGPCKPDDGGDDDISRG